LDQPARAKLDQLVAALATLEGFVRPVLGEERADVVEHDEVALLGGPLRGLHAREAIAGLVDLLLQELVGRPGLGTPNLHPAVLAELGLREDTDLEGELELRARAGQLAEVDLRIADGDDPSAVERLDVPAAETVADRFLKDRLAPKPLDHEWRR